MASLDLQTHSAFNPPLSTSQSSRPTKIGWFKLTSQPASSINHRIMCKSLFSVANINEEGYHVISSPCHRPSGKLLLSSWRSLVKSLLSSGLWRIAGSAPSSSKRRATSTLPSLIALHISESNRCFDSTNPGLLNTAAMDVTISESSPTPFPHTAS